MKLLLSFCTSLSAFFFTANGDCLRYVGKGVLPLTHALLLRFVFNIFETLSAYVWWRMKEVYVPGSGINWFPTCHAASKTGTTSLQPIKINSFLCCRTEKRKHPDQRTV
ncbi:hypothetical protein PanWU01x14_345600 [Parasponia andersonii]|uniref:Secreted protein n=1 Tax=Parasponia andersonii TaxID=3476 RepID=A0A2P5ACR5_PARAD|nr:hypothetical protein PanWU01x14_345600 [Parasponia andersonii]